MNLRRLSGYLSRSYQRATQSGEPIGPGNSFTCPICGRTSWNPNDVREGYCGNCNDWTGGNAIGLKGPAGHDVVMKNTITTVEAKCECGMDFTVVKDRGEFDAYAQANALADVRDHWEAVKK